MFGFFRKKDKDIQEVKSKKDYNFDKSHAKEILKDIMQKFGLDYSKQEFITLNKIESFAKSKEIYSFDELQERLNSDLKLYEELINLLTVNETYFFRELPQIEYLCNLVKNEPINSILCAPSSSGEEVYTILIHLDMIGIKDIKIVGIDINTQALNKAKDAIYNKRSVSQIPQEILRKYFIFKDDKYEVVDFIKQRANFSYQNVFDNLWHLGRFDIIFSRNMLIYFNSDDKNRAIEQFKKTLNYKGYLFLGHADLFTAPKGFSKIHPVLQIFKLS